MQDVNIYIETSHHGPIRKDGMYMYVLECVRDGVPFTREGGGSLQKASENQLALAALVSAMGRLRCACELHVYTGCDYIANAINNAWMREWRKAEWKTAKGAEVKNKELWEKAAGELDKHLYKVFPGAHQYTAWMRQELEHAKALRNE